MYGTCVCIPESYGRARVTEREEPFHTVYTTGFIQRVTERKEPIHRIGIYTTTHLPHHVSSTLPRDVPIKLPKERKRVVKRE